MRCWGAIKLIWEGCGDDNGRLLSTTKVRVAELRADLRRSRWMRLIRDIPRHSER